MQKHSDLNDLINIYSGYLHPLIFWVSKSSVPASVRQIANEVRNAHSHLCWSFEHSTEIQSQQIEKARDHLLRAVLDAFKLLVDAMLSKIPPSAPSPALALRNQAENALFDLWDNRAAVHWNNQFREWLNVLDWGLTALDECYEPCTLGYRDILREIGSQPVYSDAQTLSRLQVMMLSYRELLETEKYFRVLYRHRQSLHQQTDLLLFKSLIATLEDEDELSQYLDLIKQIQNDYSRDLSDYYKDEIHLAIRCSNQRIGNAFARNQLKLFENKFDLADNPNWQPLQSFYQDLLKAIQAEDTKSDLSTHTAWKQGNNVIPFDAFDQNVAIAFPKRFPVDELRSLYTVYRMLQERDSKSILDSFFRELQTKLAHWDARHPQADSLAGRGFARPWMREIMATRLTPMQQEHLGTKQRTVWFLDIVGSTADADSLQKKDWLFDHALTVFEHARGGLKDGLLPPIVVNTWGDAMVAVFDDTRSAYTTACDIAKFAHTKCIMIRMGAARGDIDIQLNPILGIDAFGKAVELAARLEPIANTGELLMDQSLGEKLQELGVAIQGESRTLKKPLNKVLEVECCVAMLF